MKKIVLLFAATAILFACNTSPKTETESATETPAIASEMVEVVLNVDGMTCEGCEKAIQAGVESLEGIASCESSFEAGWTRVKYVASQTSVEDIEGKITETGYVVEGEKTGI